MDYIWPEIFTDPDILYHPEAGEDERRGAALADTLMGWANCMAGSNPPETFGVVMVKLGEITGCLTSEDASQAAKEWLAERRATP